ncbi:MAG: hypothetical protein ACFFDF_13825 [Candidatus Odinarchaeota archaeon]
MNKEKQVRIAEDLIGIFSIGVIVFWILYFNIRIGFSVFENIEAMSPALLVLSSIFIIVIIILVIIIILLKDKIKREI